jgi:DNA-directed RNA polymerase II subunit RPB1
MTSIQNNVSKIIGIQFSILSPQEIRNSSVAEITSRDTYVNNRPVINGLFDPRMGVLEPGLICPTDGHDYMKTPGYFGHIELARPVFYIQYLPTVSKILKTICYKCSKLLISKDKYEKSLIGISGEHRWDVVFKLASKVKRCGEDSDDGCGCKQPSKIKKEGLATLIGEWDNIEGLGPDESDKMSIKFTPEMVIKMFKRITNEDVDFMGFSSVFSRPDWMICQVLAVPPPAVRPSVKHDAQQRSEDDISHTIVNIIKTNKTLQDKIDADAPGNVIDDWTTVLQYFIATQIDNKIPGVASVAQRSGRPLKSIKERLNGKWGRVRGNLMGKRVDYSARSVITPDPNLSIKQLGVPMKIAKNITKPVYVNSVNIGYLTKLVRNGPDIHPGAKILEKPNGENISLRYVDRDSIQLVEGDIVHRHMVDGDGVLFNRQPTLHRMSMMCHIAKILSVGDTFRMNVGVTKPYNADFDGDEMNLHMPQSIQSEIELKSLPFVPYQIISPANNQSIIGIFQDSLLGIYRLTRENVYFDKKSAMNLLMDYDKVDSSIINSWGDKISSFQIISLILPSLTLKYKTKQFKEGETFDTSNNVLDIHKGILSRGQIDKKILGDTTKGLIQRICNDYGNIAASDFIDNIQNIVNEYMKVSGYSVGISDLIADTDTYTKIVQTITSKKHEVKTLIDQIHLGVFENKTGKPTNEEFETQVNAILNQAASEAGKIGRQSLKSDNGFVIMVNAGSKGSDLNISQMIAALGQQNVDGKRIPHGFDDRTLPHYTKYDESPEARGFVGSSFINGLTPTELFFHAQGGRVGIIDTAVKTSETGYIQRRLIKSLEDLMVHYDMTVRNNKMKIVQFTYGDNASDPVYTEKQLLPLPEMTMEEIYQHYHVPLDDTIYTPQTFSKIKQQTESLNDIIKPIINFQLYMRKQLMIHVYNNKDDITVYSPVAFKYIINNIQAQYNIDSKTLVDITPFEIGELVNYTLTRLNKLHYAPPTLLFTSLYHYYLSPKELLIKRFNRAAIVVLLDTIEFTYKKTLCAPGEMVGMIAAQSIGEPTTQMTLNTFHFAGVASKSNVTKGVPRVQEILSLSESPKKPSLTIALLKADEFDRQRAQDIMNMIEYTKLGEVVSSVQICFDPNDSLGRDKDDPGFQQYMEFEKILNASTGTTTKEDRSNWVMRFEIDKESLLNKNITMDDINYAIQNSYKDEISCVFTDYNSDNLIFRMRLSTVLQNKNKKDEIHPLDQSDEIYLLKNYQDNLLENILLRGVKNIDKVMLRKDPSRMIYEDGKYIKKEGWILDTAGVNLLDVLALDYIDFTRTVSNSIVEIYNVLGIDAARTSIYNELTEVLADNDTYINEHHLGLLCDRMTYSYKMISVFRHGINNDDIGPIAKASFEETPEQFLKAARHACLDNVKGVSASVMCGQEGYFGTSAFQVYLDMDAIKDINSTVDIDTDSVSKKIETLFGSLENPADPCGKRKLMMNTNTDNIMNEKLGSLDEDYDIDL